MALWLVRAGKYGEHEAKFLADGAIYLTWEGLEATDLGRAEEAADIKAALQQAYPNEGSRRIANWAGQIAAFVLGVKKGDWIVLPRKSPVSIAIGEVSGPYLYTRSADPLYRHSRKVTWINSSIPRKTFDQDLLFSFGAFMTICEIQRNDAENRVRAMAKDGWRTSQLTPKSRRASANPNASDEKSSEPFVDLAPLARDQIAQEIARRHSGHGLARVVGAILESHGYTTHVSPAGPDKGVDILAAPDALGFGSPRICVQVKSGDQPVDRPTLDQLIGVMQNVGAEQGLLVSWGGFKTSVEKEAASQFFRVRLWDAETLVENLLAQYDRLPADLRAELPLKRIWVVAGSGEDA